ncbi:MAG: carboxymuconolactone decarboxylase family protein [Acidimicrobiales bacterium]
MPSRIAPPPAGELDAHAPIFEAYEQILGFVPETSRTMARVPGLLESYAALAVTVLGSGLISEQLAQLVANVTSAASGCRYCQAHTIAHAERLGTSPERLADLWSFETSERFDDAERAALRLAFHAGQHPNQVADADVEACRRHFDDDQIAAILAVCALFGFLNRWNDSLATELEPPALDAADRHLASQGWSAGKHAPAASAVMGGGS